MVEILLDTDIFIDHLRGARAIAKTSISFAYSVITRTELLAGRASGETIIRALLAPMREVVVDRAIAERAGLLRRGLNVLTPDALIAATALELRIPLMTRNRRDFERIPDLKIYAPESDPA